jgi:hypothetical protein
VSSRQVVALDAWASRFGQSPLPRHARRGSFLLEIEGEFERTAPQEGLRKNENSALSAIGGAGPRESHVDQLDTAWPHSQCVVAGPGPVVPAADYLPVVINPNHGAGDASGLPFSTT